MLKTPVVLTERHDRQRPGDHSRSAVAPSLCGEERYPWLPRPVRTRGKVAVDALRWWRSPRRRLLKRLPRAACVAEIGVWKGDFSERIRRYTSPRKLHLIDPWTFQATLQGHMYADVKDQGDMDRAYRSVQKRFDGADDVVIHRGTSADILPTFSDDFFDWVYVDGNHDCEYVLADLRMAMTKTKPGGIIAGDDFTWDRGGDGRPVQLAVMEFVQQNGLRQNLTVLSDSQFLIRLPF